MKCSFLYFHQSAYIVNYMYNETCNATRSYHSTYEHRVFVYVYIRISSLIQSGTNMQNVLFQPKHIICIIQTSERKMSERTRWSAGVGGAVVFDHSVDNVSSSSSSYISCGWARSAVPGFNRGRRCGHIRTLNEMLPGCMQRGLKLYEEIYILTFQQRLCGISVSHSFILAAGKHNNIFIYTVHLFLIELWF